MALDPGTKLGSFEIVNLVGVGGMGEVYRARDTKLGREVAIKVLPEEVAADAERLARFEREAKLLAALDHPNIGALYDFRKAVPEAGEGPEKGDSPVSASPRLGQSPFSGDVHFLVMQLVEGETLEDRLARGRLSLDEALPIFVQIAAALDAAHERGIVHRDLKPANVKISRDDVVKVLDFGIAKVTGARATPSSPDATTLPGTPTPPASLTGTEMIVGTPSYMSPEQARGRAVDKRSDVWAFGCCLYQAVTGRKPFAGDTIADTISSITRDEPDWASLPGDVPEDIQRVLHRCLEKDPKRRYSSMNDLAITLADARERLKRGRPVSATARGGNRTPNVALAAGAGLLIAAIGIVTGLAFRGGGSGSDTRVPVSETPRKIERIAVLPFVSQSGEAEQEFFADGMRDALNTELARVSSIKLIGRMAAQRYKNSDLSPGEIAEALNGVDAFVGATVMRDTDNNVRITVELMEPYTQETLWTEHYERPLRNIFQLHSEIALRIVEEIEAVLTPAETERIQATNPEIPPEAYDAYMRGIRSLNSDELSFDSAIAEFQDAVRLAPDFADAWFRIGWAHYSLISWGIVPTQDAVGNATDALHKALDLDERHSDALAHLAHIKWQIERDYPGADRMYREAIDMTPNSAGARAQYAWYLAVVGRRAEALENARIAVELEPDNAEILRWAGNFSSQAGDAKGALRLLERAHELDPGNLNLGYYLSRVYEENGMFEASVALAAEVNRLGKGQLPYRFLYGNQLAVAGRTVEAQEVVVRALADLGAGDSMPVWRAVAACTLKDFDQALSWFEAAFEARDPAITTILRVYPYTLAETSPGFGPLRQEPRYWDLIEKMNFPPFPPGHPGYAEEQAWRTRRAAEALLAEHGSTRSAAIRSLAVLPLRNGMNDPAQDYFVDGMTEEITRKLSTIASLKVISNTSARFYKDTDKRVPEIARELDVAGLIEGSVLRQGNDVKIGVSLVDGASGAQLWTSDYAGTLDNIFKLHSDVALAITDEIRATVTPDERARVATVYKAPPDAVDAYLRGRERLQEPDVAGVKAAKKLFGEAVAIAPSFASAYAGLADVATLGANWLVQPAAEAFEDWRAASEKALELDEQSTDAHTAKALGLIQFQGDYENSFRHFERALELAPGNAAAQYFYAAHLASIGRTTEAKELIQKVAEIEPDSIGVLSSYGWVHYYANEFEEASRHFSAVRDRYPESFLGYLGIANSYGAMGRTNEAIKVHKEVVRLRNRDGLSLMLLARLTLKNGDRLEARTLAEEAENAARSGNGTLSDFVRAIYATAAGDFDSALGILRNAAASKEFPFGALADPDFEPLRDDPRYWELIDELGFPPLPPDHPVYEKQRAWEVQKAAREMLREQGLVNIDDPVFDTIRDDARFREIVEQLESSTTESGRD